MRITQTMMSDTILTNLNSIDERMATSQNELSSGKQLSKPSDNPAEVAAVLNLHETVDGNNQYLQNIDSANSWLAASESGVASISDIMGRVRDLAVSGANDTNTD